MKDDVRPVGIVKVLATDFRGHVATTFGLRGFQSIMPAAMAKHDTYVYPSLTGLWSQVAKGNLALASRRAALGFVSLC